MIAPVMAVTILMVVALPRQDRTNTSPSGATSSREARTFGGPRKRLLLLLPIVYKLGVITTLLGVLVALAVKSLAVGLLLLALGVANLAVVSKLKGGHSMGGWSGGHGGGGGYGGPVHVHVHGGAGGGHSQPYAAWEPQPVPHGSHYSEQYSPPPHYRRR